MPFLPLHEWRFLKLNARRRLNHGSVLGALAVAAIVGGLAQSWAVFALVAAVLIGGAVYVGDIRLKGRRPR